MNSRKFEICCLIICVIFIIILSIFYVFLVVEINKPGVNKQYDEAELDSAMTYLGLEKCVIIEGLPYFYYDSEKYNVIAFAEEKKRKN